MLILEICKHVGLVTLVLKACYFPVSFCLLGLKWICVEIRYCTVWMFLVAWRYFV